MWMDAVSEKIAHFIGAFELIEHEARLRAEYEKFRAIKSAEDDARAIDLRSLTSKETYKLEDVDAGVRIKLATTELPQADVSITLPDIQFLFSQAAQAPMLSIGELIIGAANSAITPAGLNFKIPPPSSMAQATYQANRLSDNDSFATGAAQGFQPVPDLIEALQSIYATVSQLLPLTLELQPATADWLAVMESIQQAASAIKTGTSETLTTSVLMGGAAQGSFIDGVLVEAFAEFKDLLPAYISEKQDKAEAAAAPHDPTTDGHDFTADFGKPDSPFKVEAGHAVVAGANSLVNTASITSNWLDADVIAVAGDVIRMDAVSQLNVVIDHDSIAAAIAPGTLADQASKASNAAQIVAKSVAEAKRAAEEAAAKEAAEKGDDGTAGPEPTSTTAAQPESTALPEPVNNAELLLATAPANWAVVRYEGSVTQINWVQQTSFTTDFDQAVVTFAGAATFLGLGENSLSNSFNVQEFGYQYDLILVGGKLIDMNLISQMNILLDSDVVDVIPSAQTAPTSAIPAQTGVTAPAVTAQGQTTQTQATSSAKGTDTATQSGAAPVMAKTGTSTDGTAEQAVAISGLPSANAPAVAPAQASLQDRITDSDRTPTGSAQEGAGAATGSGPAPATASALSTGDNLAYNQASIETIGADTDAAIKQSFAEVLDDFAQGSDDIPDEIMADSAFLGTELLRVLYIDGDFTTVNMIEQVNVLGDADQVQIARDTFAAELQDMIKITTGSNVLANVAAIKDKGIDSTVMAKGNTYSDALIYQANLMDSELMETGASIADLANEAVAFLTDDLLSDQLGEDIAAMTDGLMANAMGQSDIMQTMLS